MIQYQRQKLSIERMRKRWERHLGRYENYQRVLVETALSTEDISTLYFINNELPGVNCIVDLLRWYVNTKQVKSIYQIAKQDFGISDNRFYKLIKGSKAKLRSIDIEKINNFIESKGE